jgi:hypothetical protein
MGLIQTHSIDSAHCALQNVAFIIATECRYDECHCAEWRYVESHYMSAICDECHDDECHCAECHYVQYHYAECHYDKCRFLSVVMLSVVILDFIRLYVVITNAKMLCFIIMGVYYMHVIVMNVVNVTRSVRKSWMPCCERIGDN